MKKYILTKNVNEFNEIITILGYEQVTRKKTIFKSIESVSYKKVNNSINKMVVDKYMIRSEIPFFYIILSTVIAVLLASTYLILNFTLKDNFDKLSYFFILMLPAFIMILLATSLSFLRYFNELRNLNSLAAKEVIKREVNK